MKRGSGVLWHVTSLPSEYGIGDLGAGAFWAADRLKSAGQAYWQMLPLNPTDGVYGESPYSSPSAFACNPLLLSLDKCVTDGLLLQEDIADRPSWDPNKVDYARVRQYKFPLLKKAFLAFQTDECWQVEFQNFCEKHDWLDDYAVFTALKEKFEGLSWNQWPEEYVSRQDSALQGLREECAETIGFVKFLQFMFQRQWDELRAYCHKQGIALIGDIPIYVNDDSVDVWANQKFFKLDTDHKPEYVAGVPPDYFSETGQRWGNPVYQWDVLKQSEYAWWMARLKRQFELFDIVRIDHFRGFEAYWEVPAAEKTAVNGAWVDGPKDDFFRVLQKTFPEAAIIGEDLGIITDEVTALMERFAIPGMKVLQFAFGGDLETHIYLPHNYSTRCVVYTGTHDNNTTRGWFAKDASDQEKASVSTYIRRETSQETVAGDLMELALNSRADLAIVPIQDICNLGVEARMNVPGTSEGNWGWRCSQNLVTEAAIDTLRMMTERSGRM